MEFKLTARGSSKWVKVIDLLAKPPKSEKKHAEKDIPKKWQVKSSGSDIDAGFVTVEVARKENGVYNVHFNQISVHVTQDLDVDDSHLPPTKDEKPSSTAA